eukprot:TRINITY_DN9771_c0_g1_i1.p1 TRINITY_DN9771_c0_g1~~TRINITY_DN9771_c0_g1_i1.p1  ORF type:complete len:457 (-),score=101.51 TRINITY_DN9771_c0_g1_i1:1132-2502(-)
MKLDVTVLRYMSREEFRVLTAVEQGMKNHEIVPVPLIVQIAGLRHGGAHKLLGELLRNKLLHHDRSLYDGYKLTYLGYDYLSLKAMSNRGSILGVGMKVGVGKESDIYIGIDGQEQEVILKFHRLGRVSFRAIKTKRDYLQKRKSASWLYLSRLASLKEYAYMKALHQHGFPVPTPYDHNRHCVIMSRIKGYTFTQVKKLINPEKVYGTCMNLILRFAAYGLIHCDFNEFNLMIDDEENVFVIDFPQMVSTDHENAKYYFDRDVDCIRIFFKRRFDFESDEYPVFDEDVVRRHTLDTEVEASGFSRDNERDFQKLVADQERNAEQAGEADRGSNSEDSDSEDSDSAEDSDDGGEQQPKEIVRIRDAGAPIVDVDSTEVGTDITTAITNIAPVADTVVDTAGAAQSSDGEEEAPEAEPIQLRAGWKPSRRPQRQRVKGNRTKDREKRKNTEIIRETL